MSKRRPLQDPDRRKFLKGATLASAAALAPAAADAQVNAQVNGAPRRHEGGGPGPDPDRAGDLRRPSAIP